MKCLSPFHFNFLPWAIFLHKKICVVIFWVDLWKSFGFSLWQVSGADIPIWLHFWPNSSVAPESANSSPGENQAGSKRIWWTTDEWYISPPLKSLISLDICMIFRMHLPHIISPHIRTFRHVHFVQCAILASLIFTCDDMYGCGVWGPCIWGTGVVSRVCLICSFDYQSGSG